MFALTKAVATVRRSADGIAITLEIKAGSPPMETLPDTQKLRACPNAEVTLRLAEDELRSLAGRKFEVPSSWDAEAEDHVSRFYYVEHEDIDANHVEFVRVDGRMALVRWSGMTKDVNFYDGSKPPARVEIEAAFVLMEARA